MKTHLGGLILAAAVMAAATPASAFCGFYVSGADAKLFNDATQVVLMREGTRTVLSMQNDYKGPPEKFAMVVPVPVILQKENVKTLSKDIFDHIDKLGAPRLVEYWEQDPCAPQMADSFGAMGLGLSGIGEGGGGRGEGIGLRVKVEAKFDVGEYEIVILSAKDAGGLDTWLKEEKYAIPEGAAPLFKPYVQAGSKFFVAKVDPAKVKFIDGRAALSPLRFHYDTDQFTLPVRLGMINSSGTQDLIVNILAKDSRYEVANYPNVTIPTNLDVSEQARDRFGEFYAALFDDTLAKNKGAVVTEYSWSSGSCDPCPGPTLSSADLVTLGADVLPNGTAGLSPGNVTNGVRIHPVKVTSGKLDEAVVQRIVRQNQGRYRICGGRALQTDSSATGKVTLKMAIAKDGSVKDTSIPQSEIQNKDLQSCMKSATLSLSFPAGAEEASVEVPIEITKSDPSSAPVFFSGSNPYVLTRLHARYSKETLGQDLVFKKASGITGGREVSGSDSKLEQGSKPSETNNFQARYAIRHPWKGPVECKEPRRGIWGGPPPSGDAGLMPTKPGPIPAQKLAFVPRGKVTLSSFLNAVEVDGGTRAAPAAVVEAGADAGPTAPEKKGCAGCASTTGGLESGLLAALGLSWAALRRRRRRPESR